jgi:TonB family protein
MRLAFVFLAVAVAIAQAQTFPSPNTTPPVVIYKVDPRYTKEAIEAKLQGVVTISVVITADGIPSDLTVVRGLGLGLNEKAVECVRQWRFKPGTRNSEPIAAKAMIEINFLLPAP